MYHINYCAQVIVVNVQGSWLAFASFKAFLKNSHCEEPLSLYCFQPRKVYAVVDWRRLISLTITKWSNAANNILVTCFRHCNIFAKTRRRITTTISLSRQKWLWVHARALFSTENWLTLSCSRCLCYNIFTSSRESYRLWQVCLALL